ncbi:unnamed protein product, partial [Rotaria sordida]
VFIFNLGGKMKGTESRISILVSSGTQTENLNALHHVNTSVTIPFMHYITLNSVYYEKIYRSVRTCDTSTDDLMGYTNGEGHTAPLSSTAVSTGTFLEINLVSSSSSPMNSKIGDENVKNDSEKSAAEVESNKIKNVVDSSTTDMTLYSSKSSSTSSKSSATTKSYGELPKIPFKTYMEKQKKREKIEQSTKNNSRSPILISHLADSGRRKSTIEEVTNTKSLSTGSATS